MVPRWTEGPAAWVFRMSIIPSADSVEFPRPLLLEIEPLLKVVMV